MEQRAGGRGTKVAMTNFPPPTASEISGDAISCPSVVGGSHLHYAPGGNSRSRCSHRPPPIGEAAATDALTGAAAASEW